MALKKCKVCEKLFNSIGTPFCPECVKEMDYKYKTVRDYLYDNPNESVEDVSINTDTPEWMIIHFLRDGRLAMASASGLIRCEQCGASITSGRFCDDCAMKFGLQIKGARENLQNKPKGPRMHINDD